LPETVTVSNLYQDLAARMSAFRRDSDSVKRSREVVENALGGTQALYGINTGFGVLAGERIDESQLEKLQENLILSHSVGVGDLVPKNLCRLMLLLKIQSLGLGYSGVSPEVFNRLLLFAERDLIPSVPSRGSVGASGDLAPLAHMALPLIGRGTFWDSEGSDVLQAEDILAREGLQPIKLKPKDGLSLINGTQFMNAYAAYVLERSQHLVKLADIVSMMSLEALQGSIKPFDPRIAGVRPHPGARAVSENVRRLLEGSEILESHRDCGKVQDPYCLRCVPQVHGASRDGLAHCVSTCEVEMNSVTDNPLVFSNGDIISGGNFHGQPLALTMDYAAIALSELASISERRTYLLLGGHDGLPRLLMEETGINSGFMIPQYAAAALVSENKVLSHPAAVDSIPTSLGQEDHVSMGSVSAVKLYQVLRNVETVFAVELLTATQALDFRKPLKPGRGVMYAHQYLRSILPHRKSDFYFKQDLDRSIEVVQLNELNGIVEESVGSLN
jgi:histidine ammonia-lyase